MLDVGLYAEDEWGIRPNISLSYGLRYETQTGIPYEGDWAPRLSFSWGLGHSKVPKTVIRAGYGIFYDRFSYDYLLQAERYNGVTQQQYIVANPTFYPAIPTPAQLAQLSTTSPTMYQVQSNLQVPYTMEAAISLERQVTKNATVACHVFELAWCASTLSAQCQCAAAGHVQSHRPKQWDSSAGQ